MLDFTVQFTGRTPLVVHNIRLANPLDPYAKKLKSLSSIRKKTEDIHLEMMNVEWEGGLYHDDELGPYVPVSYPVACIRQAGAITRDKTSIMRAVVVMADDGGDRVPIEYDGPRSIDDMWEDDDYRDVRMVRVQSSRTLRTRPRFPDWKLSFRLTLDEEILNPETLEAVIQRAGRNIGIGESPEGSRARFDVELAPVASSGLKVAA